MAREMIHIPGRMLEYLKPGKQAIVRISPEAYNALVDYANESAWSIGRIATEIILQSKDCVMIDRDGRINDDGDIV